MVWVAFTYVAYIFRDVFVIDTIILLLQKDSMHESSFYSGKTAYGGASAYRRSSLNSSLPYQVNGFLFNKPTI